MSLTLAQLGRRFWMPDSASSFSGDTDFLFYFIYWVSAVAVVLILTLMTAFVIRYRHRSDRAPAVPGPSHSTALELTWSIIPAGFMLAIFYLGFRGFLNMATPPDYALEIQVTAVKWDWQFTYPNGATSSDLHVPLNRPVKLILSSQDVIHSLFIPAFRIKKDAVPGRYNITWFQATQIAPVREDGQKYFDLYCTEYCGTKHSEMRRKVVVQDATEFARWLEDAANWVQRTPPVEAGARLFAMRGCTQCHSADGSSGIGPTLKNLFGHEAVLRDGAKVTVEENYLRESLLVPGAKIVAGFDNVMPSFQGRLKDTEITALIEWLKSISDKGPPPLKAWPATTTQPGGATQPATQARSGAGWHGPAGVRGGMPVSGALAKRTGKSLSSDLPVPPGVVHP